MAFDYDMAAFIPFQDAEACRRVRAIRKEEITRHPNPDFKIRVIEDAHELYNEFAVDIVRRIWEKGEADSTSVLSSSRPRYRELRSMVTPPVELTCRPPRRPWPGERVAHRERTGISPLVEPVA